MSDLAPLSDAQRKAILEALTEEERRQVLFGGGFGAIQVRERSGLDKFKDFFTDYLPDVGKTIKDGIGDVANDLNDLTGGVLSDVEKLVKLTITILEKLIEIFPKLLDFAQWIIDYLFKILNDPDLGEKLKLLGWAALGAVIFWLAFPVILNKIL